MHLRKWEMTSSHIISSKGQNQNNYETRSTSEIEIENIYEETQNLNFDPEKIVVAQRMSEDFKAEIALVTTAPEVVKSSNEAVTSPDFAEEETPKEKLECDSHGMFSDCKSDFEIDEILIYDYDFSWGSFMPLQNSLKSLGTREICELELLETIFRNVFFIFLV